MLLGGEGRLGGPVGYPISSEMVDLHVHSCTRDNVCSHCHCHPRGDQILLSLLLGVVEVGDLVVFPRPGPSHLKGHFYPHLDPHALAYVAGGPSLTSRLRLRAGTELS